jgi:hypothetical protein
MRHVGLRSDPKDIVSQEQLQPTRTWQDMTASRAPSTTYTAPSDSDIHVMISAVAASNVYVHGKVGSLPVFGNGAPNVVSGDDVASISFPVPAGGTYRLEAISGTLRWLEYRP